MSIESIIYLILVCAGGVFLSLSLPYNLPRFLKALIGPALGIIFTTETVLLLSLLFGFSQISLAAALIIFIASVSILTRFKIKTHPMRFQLSIFLKLPLAYARGFFKYALSGTEIRPKRKNISASHDLTIGDFREGGLKAYWALFFIVITFGTLVVFLFFTKVLTPSPQGLTTGGGGLYGDTAMHSAFTMGLANQGIPPQNPLFAGKSLIYPFMVNLFSASLVKLGMNLRFAMILPQIAYFLGFLALFYTVSRKFSGNLGTLLTVAIFFLGWGLGFSVFIQDAIRNHSLSVFREYTNNLPGFFLHNPLTGLILPERSFLPGLFIGMLITILILNLFLRNKSSTDNPPPATYNSLLTTYNLQLATIGILLGILPLWHTHSFIFFGVSLFFWLLLYSNKSSFEAQKPKAAFSHILIYEKLPRLIIVYGVAGILAIPQLLWIQKNLISASFLHFDIGWMDSEKNPLLFWFRNTGLIIPLFLGGIFLVKKTVRVFFLPAIIMFLIVNLVSFQPWDWDNIKILTWVFLFLAIPAGHFLSTFIRDKYALILPKNHYVFDLNRGKISTPIFFLFKFSIFILIFISLTASGILSLSLASKQNHTIYDKADIELAEWVKTNTLPADVFLIDPWPNHPIPGLTGRNVYLGYPGHLWVHGIDYGKRETQVKQILEGDLGLLKSTDVPVNYLVVPTPERDKFASSLLNIVFTNQKFMVFEITVH